MLAHTQTNTHFHRKLVHTFIREAYKFATKFDTNIHMVLSKLTDKAQEHLFSATILLEMERRNEREDWWREKGIMFEGGKVHFNKRRR